MVGWALPDHFPPRNGRTSKALKALGDDVTIHVEQAYQVLSCPPLTSTWSKTNGISRSQRKADFHPLWQIAGLAAPGLCAQSENSHRRKNPRSVDEGMSALAADARPLRKRSEWGLSAGSVENNMEKQSEGGSIVEVIQI